MSVRLIVRNTGVFLLALLWIYAALSKLIDWEHFNWEMHNQALPGFLKDSLVYILPAVELLTALSLFFDRAIATGIWVSLIMFVFFTVYIGLVIGHAFSYIPCSCGGILSQLNWGQHLAFNLTFIALTLTIIIIDKKGGPVTSMT